MEIFSIFAIVLFAIRLACYKGKGQFLLSVIFTILFMGCYANMTEDTSTVMGATFLSVLITHLIAKGRRNSWIKKSASQSAATNPPAQGKTPVTPPQRPATPPQRPATPPQRPVTQAPNPTAQGKQVTDYLHNCVRCRSPLSHARCRACGYNHEENTFATLMPLYFE